VTADGRLCARDVLTRTSLIEQQTAFFENVGKNYGLQRGEPGGSGKRREHLETAEYKKAMSMEQNMRSNASKMAVAAQNMQEGIKVLEKQKNVLERKISTLESDFKGHVLTANDLNQIKPEKGLMGSVKNITVEDVENLKKTAFQYVQSKKEFENMSRECERLKKIINDLRSKLPSLTDKVTEVKEKERLKEIEKAFLRLPAELKEQVLTKNNQTQERGFDRGR
jgi:cell division protein FtsB